MEWYLAFLVWILCESQRHFDKIGKGRELIYLGHDICLELMTLIVQYFQPTLVLDLTLHFSKNRGILFPERLVAWLCHSIPNDESYKKIGRGGLGPEVRVLRKIFIILIMNKIEIAN